MSSLTISGKRPSATPVRLAGSSTAMSAKKKTGASPGLKTSLLNNNPRTLATISPTKKSQEHVTSHGNSIQSHSSRRRTLSSASNASTLTNASRTSISQKPLSHVKPSRDAETSSPNKTRKQSNPSRSSSATPIPLKKPVTKVVKNSDRIQPTEQGFAFTEGFLQLLNEKATVIQRWYRRKKRRIPQRDSDDTVSESQQQDVTENELHDSFPSMPLDKGNHASDATLSSAEHDGESRPSSPVVTQDQPRSLLNDVLKATEVVSAEESNVQEIDLEVTYESDFEDMDDNAGESPIKSTPATHVTCIYSDEDVTTMERNLLHDTYLKSLHYENHDEEIAVPAMHGDDENVDVYDQRDSDSEHDQVEQEHENQDYLDSDETNQVVVDDDDVLPMDKESRLELQKMNLVLSESLTSTPLPSSPSKSLQTVSTIRESHTRQPYSRPPSSISILKMDNSAATQPSSTSEVTTEDRVGRILGFLKNVQQEGTRSSHISSPSFSTDHPVKMMADFLRDSSSETSHQTNNTAAASAVFDGVKAKILGQQMELEEKTRSIDFLKRELKKAKESYKEHVAQSQKDLKSQLALQRKEYETIVKRHLSFIDKLLAEKEELSGQSEQLTNQVKQLERQFQEKTRQLEEKQERDLKQQKELWQAAEKLKRDKWIQEKTKAIKDQTVKGLEPEIQRMIAQHKLQVRQLEEKFRDQLLHEKSLATEETQRQLSNLRERLTSERQKACDEEREFARQRFQKQLEREEMEFQQQKRKLLAEFDEQKHQLMEGFKRERQSEMSAHRKEVEECKRAFQVEKEAKEQVLEETRKRHTQEINNLKEKAQIEKEEWQSHYMKKIETEMRSREKQFKEKLLQERDAEIDLVISRLEQETSSSSSDISRRHRLELEKIRSSHAEEVKSLRDQHSLALDKVLSLQSHVACVEEERRQVQKQVLRLQNEMSVKEGVIRQQKQELSRLKVDEQTLSETIREEFHERLEDKERDIIALQREIQKARQLQSQMESDFKKDIERVMSDKNASISTIEENVLQAINIKDEHIAHLQEQLKEMHIRNKHLEDMIDKQRKELLVC